VLNNAVNGTDPSGLQCSVNVETGEMECFGDVTGMGQTSTIRTFVPEIPPNCRVGGWDCEAVRNVRALKQAFLNSARRHNKTTMDDNGFAALIAAVIVAESRIGNVPPDGTKYDRASQRLENLVAHFGCTVSGHYIDEALKNKDYLQLAKYFLNLEIPDAPPLQAHPTVGIGNVALYTANNLWLGQACNAFHECTPVQVNHLKADFVFGLERYIEDPYAKTSFCDNFLDPYCLASKVSSGAFKTYVHKELAQQLLIKEVNIEYVAANLEAGALRAMQNGVEANAFNLAVWHAHGVMTNDEIDRYKDIGRTVGSALGVLRDIPTALSVWGLTSNWDASREQRYQSCIGGGWPCD
jgi:hypothetical protein